jgi:hypothetical protein
MMSTWGDRWCRMGWLIAAGALLVGAPAGGARGGDKPKDRPDHLEFRILANRRDDGKALEAARRYFAKAKEDARLRAELGQRARDGLPPAPLSLATDKAPGYTWAEVGPAELRSLRLDNAAEKDTPPVPEGSTTPRNALWQQVARARAKGEPFVLERHLGECLLYSRPCENAKLSKEERGRKKVEYFLLTRDPHKGKAVTGAYLTHVKAGSDVRDAPCIEFRLNKRGGDLFFELTSANKPSEDDRGSFRRHLAILLDGKVVAAPALHGPIRSEGVISSGSFRRAEADRWVEVLRSDLPRARK